MYRHRTEQIIGGPTFETLDEFHATLTSEKYKHLLDHSNGTISTDLIKAGDTTSLVFRDLKFVALFKKSDILNIDATFRTVPFIGTKRKYQLLMVIAVIHDHVSCLNIYINGPFQASSTSLSDLIKTAFKVCVYYKRSLDFLQIFVKHLYAGFK